MTLKKNIKKIYKETSAGGIVFDFESKEHDSIKLLMIQVKNLKKEMVWTFPKGHIEKNESETEAALREVLEETGWKCKIFKINNNNYLKKVFYQFKRNEKWIHKKVVWYLMVPITKAGNKDPEEVLEVNWFSPEEAQKKVKYPSDKIILKLLAGIRTKLKENNRRPQ